MSELDKYHNVKREKDEENASKLIVKVKAGSDRIKCKSVFCSFKSKYLFVPYGCNVKVFCTATGECLRDLVGHQTAVVSIQHNPEVLFQIFTCSEDGEVFLWEYEDGLILKTYNLNFQNPIKAFYIPHKEFSWYVIVKKNNEDFYRLFHVPVNAGNVKQKRFLLKPVLPKQNCVSFGSKEEYVASVNDNSLRVLHISSNSFKRHITGIRKLTCVACHPSEIILATGDDSGQILIWNDFLKSNQPSRSVYHWHTLPVEDLVFSFEGSHLYSGGGECVLVKWKIGTDVQHFLPRMGYPIKYITVSAHNAYIASSHIDNGINLINNQNKIEQIFQGLTQNCMFGLNEYSALNILLYDPKNHALVLKGKPGCLQFYNPDEDRHLFSINVTGENYISKDRDADVINTIIDTVDIDSDGMWLATAEHWDDTELSPHIRLKFWKFIEESQKYQLNTNIFLPHKKRVKSIKFRPKTEFPTPLAVTISEDNFFKLWSVFTDEDDDEDKETWNCFYEDDYANLVPTCAEFSEDGSMLAVAFEYIITLWDSETNKHLKNLYMLGEDRTIREMAFGRDTCSHLLVCVSKECIEVWNLLTLKVTLEIRIQAFCLTTDPESSIMTVFDKNKKLFVFTPDNPKPIYTHKNAYTETVTNSTFFPRKTEQEEGWQKYSQLYYMNEKQELIMLAEETESKQNLPIWNSEQFYYQPNTPFARLMAEHQAHGPVQHKMPNFNQDGTLGVDVLTMIKNTPTYLLPPLSTFAEEYLSSTLIPLKRDEANTKDESEPDMDRDAELQDSKENNCMEIDNVSQQIDLKAILEENYDWLDV
ncbi:WD repeat-containing protein 75-like [Centruroides sculpturatus]|uniref:WD repeat-containing protein 75-like n=1 Tax=Centruroides sculpturatus TaxID=218467 RepID=UPI000C6DD452|nr:WD repeat-containing protein 75-like [Centruroides sculpturatus]